MNHKVLRARCAGIVVIERLGVEQLPDVFSAANCGESPQSLVLTINGGRDISRMRWVAQVIRCTSSRPVLRKQRKPLAYIAIERMDRFTHALAKQILFPESTHEAAIERLLKIKASDRLE